MVEIKSHNSIATLIQLLKLRGKESHVIWYGSIWPITFAFRMNWTIAPNDEYEKMNQILIDEGITDRIINLEKLFEIIKR